MTTKNKFQVTEWAPRSEEMGRTSFFERGQYGDYLYWEAERWNETRNGWHAWVEQNQDQVVLPNGYVAEKGEVIALFSRPEYMKPVDPEEAT